MSDDRTISLWIEQLCNGADATAVEVLWQNYFKRLVELARAKLRNKNRRIADEEDVALSAFDSFCRGAEQHRFPKLQNRDDLWRLLVTITARKAYDLVQREGRARRGGGKVRGDSVFGSPVVAGWEEIAGHEPTPQFAAQTAEEYRRLLELLGDDELRSIAVWKMEGYTSEEVAAKLGCALPTIERRMRLIRKTWSAQLTIQSGEL